MKVTQLTDKREQQLRIQKHAAVGEVFQVAVIDGHANKHAGVSDGVDCAHELFREAGADARGVRVPGDKNRVYRVG